MASIKLTGDTSGEITISAPAVAGTNTLTLPASTGEILTTSNQSTNTPAFRVGMSADQAVSDGATTKVNFDTVQFNLGFSYDTTNKRFIVPSGGAGYYFFTTHVFMVTDVASIIACFLELYKNGSASSVAENQTNFSNNYIMKSSNPISSVISLAEGDYIEVFGHINTTGSPSDREFHKGTNSVHALFQGYKLIT